VRRCGQIVSEQVFDLGNDTPIGYPAAPGGQENARSS
jgi:hypothetical protein